MFCSWSSDRYDKRTQDFSCVLLDTPPGRVYDLAMSTELTISGMTCGHCQTAVTRALQSVSGVQTAEVDLKTGQARVEGEADLQALLAAVSEEGYTAQVRQ